MSTYRIVCTRLARGAEHEHVAAVGVETAPGDPVELWPVARVRQALFAGDFLYTEGAHADDITWIESHTCACGVTTIRSDPDSTAASSLDSVPMCSDDEECIELRDSLTSAGDVQLSVVELSSRRLTPR